MRFKIDPKAVWDDGSPITSSDFDFTWKAIEHTTRVYVQTEAYELVRAIDTTDPAIAVIQLREPFAEWVSLFGGAFGYVLKKAAFPKADPDKPDLEREMLGEIPFSGGPFRLQSWDRSKEVLVRNDRYWGTLPFLDRVTFLPTTDQTEEIRTLYGGEVAAIFPSVSDPGLLDLLRKRNIRATGSDGLYFEALWFSHEIKPLDNPRVREALMYAFGRQAIVDKLINPNNPRAAVLNCGFVAFPRMGSWCRTRPFERFTYDPARARRILESGGYECSATFCTKDGELLEIEYWTNSANDRRRATQSMVIEQAREAGFTLKQRTFESTGYFNSPDDFPIADYATGGEGEPSVTELFGCNEIPSEENNYYGQNWIHWCNPEADRLMRESDREIDPQRRLALMERIYELEAQDFVSLPLYLLPR